MPRPDRKYYRDDDPLPEAPEGDTGESIENTTTLADRRAATPSPELFRDNLNGSKDDISDKSESKALPGGTYVDPEYVPKKPTFLDRINPFAKKE